MHRNNNNNNEEEEKEENAVLRILQSSTCRRLFSWGGPGAVPCDVSDAARREQRDRWNFDFQTETPLPGRYQWVRTISPEGNGDAAAAAPGQSRTTPCGGAKRRTPPSETQLSLPEKRRLETREGSCDMSLNDPQNSDERSLGLEDPSYHVDLT